MKAFFCILLVIIMTLFVSCNNIDPNTSQNTTTASTSAASGESNEIPDYIDADALANRSYELRYLIAAKKFDSPADLSVNALVQFAFCHLYYENLIDMPTSGNKLREASADDIKLELLKQFGSVDVDITAADLYNSGKKKFEMWEPHYGTEIFYDVSVVADSDNCYKAVTDFYTDSSKSERKGKTVLTVKDIGGKVFIQKLSSAG